MKHIKFWILVLVLMIGFSSIGRGQKNSWPTYDTISTSTDSITIVIHSNSLTGIYDLQLNFGELDTCTFYDFCYSRSVPDSLVGFDSTFLPYTQLFVLRTNDTTDTVTVWRNNPNTTGDIMLEVLNVNGHGNDCWINFPPNNSTNNGHPSLSTKLATVKTPINDTRLSIYPNPVTSTLRIQSDRPNTYTIFNISGTKIFESSENAISVSSLPNGFYYVVDKNGNYVGNFVKN